MPDDQQYQDGQVDNLDEAQQLVHHTRLVYSSASLEIAKTLALIDIGRSLRDIRDELHDMNLYGIKQGGR